VVLIVSPAAPKKPFPQARGIWGSQPTEFVTISLQNFAGSAQPTEFVTISLQNSTGSAQPTEFVTVSLQDSAGSAHTRAVVSFLSKSGR
jgi:hypothetical protein